MISAQRVAQILGGQTVLKRRIRSSQDLRALVERGLPKSSLPRVFRTLDLPSRETARWMDGVVPQATFKRRKDLLRPDESERTERIARVIATAEYVWDDREEARRFLLTPHPALSGSAPLAVARGELGARAVEDLLWKLFYGIPS